MYEPPRDKTNKVSVRPAKTQISLGIRPAWSESSLSAWRKLGSLATHWGHSEDSDQPGHPHSEDSDQTGRMPRLIWLFAGHRLILLVLSWDGLYLENSTYKFSIPGRTWKRQLISSWQLSVFMMQSSLSYNFFFYWKLLHLTMKFSCLLTKLFSNL